MNKFLKIFFLVTEENDLNFILARDPKMMVAKFGV